MTMTITITITILNHLSFITCANPGIPPSAYYTDMVDSHYCTLSVPVAHSHEMTSSSTPIYHSLFSLRMNSSTGIIGNETYHTTVDVGVRLVYEDEDDWSRMHRGINGMRMRMDIERIVQINIDQIFLGLLQRPFVQSRAEYRISSSGTLFISNMEVKNEIVVHIRGRREVEKVDKIETGEIRIIPYTKYDKKNDMLVNRKVVERLNEYLEWVSKYGCEEQRGDTVLGDKSEYEKYQEEMTKVYEEYMREVDE
ncbi:hypothetical protein ECANGB1_778 [Enterospora canceri]|uniref:Uncharacterized protein n=1 Tax=Enterospora canceri TaxID=1081671 RepID=A0A1Y1S7F0_9MICR|nr:hypothetical protein ECANGB1_778 [Enterospora canceri]